MPSIKWVTSALSTRSMAPGSSLRINPRKRSKTLSMPSPVLAFSSAQLRSSIQNRGRVPGDAVERELLQVVLDAGIGRRDEHPDAGPVPDLIVVHAGAGRGRAQTPRWANRSRLRNRADRNRQAALPPVSHATRAPSGLARRMPSTRYGVTVSTLSPRMLKERLARRHSAESGVVVADQEVGHHDAGTQGADSDAGAIGILAQRLGEVVDRPLGGAVGREAGLRHAVAAEALHVPDLAAALLLHAGHDNPVGEQHGGEVGVHERGQILRRLLPTAVPGRC